jgi:hypothetical protein
VKNHLPSRVSDLDCASKEEGVEMENINLRGPRSTTGIAPNVKKEQDTHAMKLHPAEVKLIQVIRAIEFGEIEGLKIEDGLPAYYKGARKTCKLA